MITSHFSSEKTFEFKNKYKYYIDLYIRTGHFFFYLYIFDKGTDTISIIPLQFITNSNEKKMLCTIYNMYLLLTLEVEFESFFTNETCRTRLLTLNLSKYIK